MLVLVGVCKSIVLLLLDAGDVVLDNMVVRVDEGNSGQL